MPAIFHVRFMRNPLSVNGADSPEPGCPLVFSDCVDWDADDTGAPERVKHKKRENPAIVAKSLSLPGSRPTLWSGAFEWFFPLAIAEVWSMSSRKVLLALGGIAG